MDAPDWRHEPLSIPLIEAARLLGIPMSTAYRLVELDRFPVRAYRVGWRLYCRRADVDAFLADPPYPH